MVLGGGSPPRAQRVASAKREFGVAAGWPGLLALGNEAVSNKLGRGRRSDMDEYPDDEDMEAMFELENDIAQEMMREQEDERANDPPPAPAPARVSAPAVPGLDVGLQKEAARLRALFLTDPRFAPSYAPAAEAAPPSGQATPGGPGAAAGGPHVDARELHNVTAGNLPVKCFAKFLAGLVGASRASPYHEVWLGGGAQRRRSPRSVVFSHVWLQGHAVSVDLTNQSLVLDDGSGARATVRYGGPHFAMGQGNEHFETLCGDLATGEAVPAGDRYVFVLGRWVAPAVAGGGGIEIEAVNIYRAGMAPPWHFKPGHRRPQAAASPAAAGGAPPILSAAWAATHEKGWIKARKKIVKRRTVVTLEDEYAVAERDAGGAAPLEADPNVASLWALEVVDFWLEATGWAAR